MGDHPTNHATHNTQRAAHPASLLAHIRRTVERYDLLRPGDRVVVGVSGGPDSLCLLHLLVQLQEPYRLALHVAHLNHRLRGAEAEADAAFVARLAADWGLPCTVEEVDVAAHAQARRLSIEEAARQVRYTFLARVAHRIGTTTIAVGHNADDQTETVLMHFLRGSGLAGLRGMLPKTPLGEMRLGAPLPAPDLVLIRPLLEVPRAAIEAYCAAHGLEPRFDRSNLDTTYFRNRLRHELLPLLEQYNPRIREVLRRTASVIAADYQVLEAVREAAWRRVVRQETEEAVQFDRAGWQALPLALQRATLRQAIHRLRRALRNIDFVHIENAIAVALQGEVGAQATLPQGLMLTVEPETLLVADADYRPPPPDWPMLRREEPLPVALPGETPLPESDWLLEATWLEAWDEAVFHNPDRWTAHVAGEAITGPLFLRRRRPGDRFCPLGMEGHRVALADFLTNAKVPRRWRDLLPLLVVGEQILWVAGWRLDERARVTPTTRRVLRLRFRKRSR